jgi:hypothetical protein
MRRSVLIFWEGLWIAFLLIVLVCTFAASVRIAFVGLGHLPANRWVKFVTHDGWTASLFFLLPMNLGSIARREVSPLPWTAFSNAAARHGIMDGVFELVCVLIVEFWVLGLPAQSYILNRPGLDRRTLILVRCLNLAVGLLLLTPYNPVYEFMVLLPKQDPDDFGP